MTRTRIMGLLAALLGVALVIYSLSGLMTIFQHGSAGIGAIGPVQVCPGILLLIAGLVAFAIGKPKLK